MRSNRLTTFILGYCLVLLLGAAVFGVVGKEKVGAAVNIETPEPELIAEGQIPEEIPSTPAVTPTPVVLHGATDNWNMFVMELGFNWEEISDKPCVLFKKPEASNDSGIEGFISDENGNTVDITLLNCEYTDFYYTSLERRANGHYFNAQPPVAQNTDIIVEQKNDNTKSSQETKALSIDPYSDPLRGLECRTVREADGSYTITVRLTMDKTYDYKLFESECFYVVALCRENTEGSEK